MSVDIKLFGKWDCSSIKVTDPSLVRYVNLKPIIFPSTGGKVAKERFGKAKVHVVERLINKLMVTGHYSGGKKHYFTSGRNSGKKAMASRVVREAFEILEKKTKKNPVQLFINAVENGAPRAEITSVEYGGIRHPVAVDCAPQRRLDIALGMLAKGAMKRSLGSKNTISQCLADEIELAAANDSKALVIEKKTTLEKQAEASR